MCMDSDVGEYRSGMKGAEVMAWEWEGGLGDGPGPGFEAGIDCFTWHSCIYRRKAD